MASVFDENASDDDEHVFDAKKKAKEGEEVEGGGGKESGGGGRGGGGGGEEATINAQNAVIKLFVVMFNREKQRLFNMLQTSNTVCCEESFSLLLHNVRLGESMNHDQKFKPYNFWLWRSTLE